MSSGIVFDHLSRWGDIRAIQLRHRLSRDEVVERQNRRLRGVIDCAYRDVPYYRRLFDEAGIEPKDIRGLSDLERLPMSSKRDLRKAPPGSLVSGAVRPDRLPSFHTTGSTGVPLAVKRTKAEDLLFHLFRMRAIRSYGLRPRDRVVRVRSGNAGYVPLSWKLARAFRLFRQSMVDTAEPPQANAEALLGLRPDVVTGYSSSLARIARVIAIDKGAVLPLRFAVGGADMLTPLFRKQIRDAFRGPVYDTYECVELGLMAWECRETGLYHVCDDNVILEILKDGRPAREGETGEVVATSLHLRAMPFIRYRLDDIVTLGPPSCPCGLPFPTLKAIDAKRQDYFRLPDGRELYPWAISLFLIENAPWALQFEIVQERLDRVALRFEALSPPAEADLDRLRKGVQPLLGPGVELGIQIVRELSPTPGGKFWPRRSLVRTMYDDVEVPFPGPEKGP